MTQLVEHATRIRRAQVSSPGLAAAFFFHFLLHVAAVLPWKNANKQIAPRIEPGVFVLVYQWLNLKKLGDSTGGS